MDQVVSVEEELVSALDLDPVLEPVPFLDLVLALVLVLRLVPSLVLRLAPSLVLRLVPSLVSQLVSRSGPVVLYVSEVFLVFVVQVLFFVFLNKIYCCEICANLFQIQQIKLVHVVFSPLNLLLTDFYKCIKSFP